MLAILFAPMAHPAPTLPPELPPGEVRTPANTPYGYGIPNQDYYGLDSQNLRFFIIVAVWYVVSVILVVVSLHALACALEGSKLRDPPPENSIRRRRWWLLRLGPFLVLAGSLFTDFSRGQVDVVMLGALSLGLYLVSAGREFWGGTLLAIPGCIKLFPFVLLGYPVWRRRWRMAFGAAAGLLFALIILPAIAMGPQRTFAMYKVWTHVLVKPSVGKGTDTSRRRELTGMTGTDNQSLLAAIHNWTYMKQARSERPDAVEPWERHWVYAIGALLLAGIGFCLGTRRSDSPQELLIGAGLLMGLGLIVNPVAHNYYFLLVLPMIAALIDRGFGDGAWRVGDWRVLAPVLVFMLVDLLARLSIPGRAMRDLGIPMLSLLYVMWTGAMILRRGATRPA
jgi:hypothetical protein